jgi:hypothetical protein
MKPELVFLMQDHFFAVSTPYFTDATHSPLFTDVMIWTGMYFVTFADMCPCGRDSELNLIVDIDQFQFKVVELSNEEREQQAKQFSSREEMLNFFDWQPVRLSVIN